MQAYHYFNILILLFLITNTGLIIFSKLEKGEDFPRWTPLG
jgi:hypothetical protein